MKKIILVLFAVTFVSSLCFAQQSSVPVSKAATKPVEIKTFTGKVVAVSLANPAKGTNSKLEVVNEAGQKLSFVIRVNTTITAKDGRILSLSEIKNGDKASLEYYTTKKGINRAKSIKMVE